MKKNEPFNVKVGTWGCLLLVIAIAAWMGLVIGGVLLKLTRWALN